MTSISKPTCIVHYHELGLKGHNRPRFERQLINNIVRTLAPNYAHAKVSKISGRLLIQNIEAAQREPIAKLVALMPGVAKVSYGLRTTREMDDIYTAAVEVLAACEPFASFKVDARRANTDFRIDSMELNKLVGSALFDKFPSKKIQMREPDATVHVQVVEGSTYVFAHDVKGIGGLPLGSSGIVVSLLSAGLDSPVASWRMMRRGAQVVGLHFSGRPEVLADSEDLVRMIGEKLLPAGGLKALYIVPFGSYQRQISAAVPPSLRVIIYRRLMFAVAEQLAHKVRAKALVTGESLGQVASQTLDNIAAVEAHIAMPILRPLIGTDKIEIIAEAQRLGTFDISSTSHDDCCTLYMPRNPETHAKLSDVNEVWSKLPVTQWLTQILSDLEKL
jgi:thiamine biosynthesis protein ThiI